MRKGIIIGNPETDDSMSNKFRGGIKKAPTGTIILSAILRRADPLWSQMVSIVLSLTSTHKYPIEISPCLLEQKCILCSFLNQFLVIGIEKKHMAMQRVNHINKFGFCLESIKRQMDIGRQPTISARSKIFIISI